MINIWNNFLEIIKHERNTHIYTLSNRYVELVRCCHLSCIVALFARFTQLKISAIFLNSPFFESFEKVINQNWSWILFFRRWNDIKLHSALLIEGFEKAESWLKCSQENGLRGNFQDSWIVFSFTLNINGDPNHDFNFKLVWAISDTCSLKWELVISDDDISSAFLEEVIKFRELIPFLDLFFIFLFLLFSGSTDEVELDVYLFLDAELLLNGLSQLLDFEWGLELNESLLSCFLNLRTCVNYLTSILRLLSCLDNFMLASEGIYDRNFWFVFSRLSLSCRLSGWRPTCSLLSNGDDNTAVVLNSCVIKLSRILFKGVSTFNMKQDAIYVYIT